jgi:hypothetical protein
MLLGMVLLPIKSKIATRLNILFLFLLKGWSSKPTMALHIFQWLCEAYQIHHTTGIPYNPQGQAIVEHAHATLKMQLQKLKGGDEVLPPANQLHKALYTLNFLNCSEQV